MSNRETTLATKPGSPSGWGGILQRKCGCGNHTFGGGPCSECQTKQSSLGRAVRNPEIETANSGSVPRIVHDVLHSPGQPLDTSSRSFFESRFGHDFSRVTAHISRQVAPSGELSMGAANDRFEQEADQVAQRVSHSAPPLRSSTTPHYDFSRVRVHTDVQAAQSARAINALAYTVGENIVFGAGQYAPGSKQGNRLLAHELTHVAQQEGSSPTQQIQRKVVDDNAHVTCRATRPGAVAAITSAEADAIVMAEGAAAEIRSRLALHALVPAIGESPGLRRFRDSLWRRFGFDYNLAQVRNTNLPLLARRYELVASWIRRLNHRYPCGAVGVEPPGDCTTQPGVGLAWTSSGIDQTALCDGFWNQPAADDRAETILHEWFHFGFDWLGDCEQRNNQNNTVCYDMFAGEIAGTVTAADYAACCAPPAGALPPLAGP
ncbi:MAG: DUF4157 domain-containing protein [Acidobacteriota bacterium]